MILQNATNIGFVFMLLVGPLTDFSIKSGLRKHQMLIETTAVQILDHARKAGFFREPNISGTVRTFLVMLIT